MSDTNKTLPIASLTIRNFETLTPEWRQELLGWLRRQIAQLNERPRGEKLAKLFTARLYPS